MLTIETLGKGVECLELTIKVPERRHLGHFGVAFVEFEHISNLFLLFLLLTLRMHLPSG